MGKRIAGITIEIDGDGSKFQSEMKKLDKSLGKTQSSLKDVNRLLKFNPGNTELLTQKQKLLKKSIEDTKTRLQQLKQAAKNATPESLGEEKYDALQREIVETESKLKNLKAQYNDFGSVAKQKLQVVSDKMKEVGAKMTSVGKSMTTSFTLPIVAAFTVATKSASDYEENLNKIQVAFGDNADEVTEWSNNAIKEFGLSKLAATDAVSSFGALGKGIGLTSDEAAGMSMNLAGLSADLASYFNTSTDESAKALEGIFTGETEALKKFGVVMNETNLKQFAEDQGLVYDEMSQTEKVMLRYNYVLEKTSDAQGDYSRTSDGTANSMKTFKAALEDLSVALGTQLLPIITPIIQKITEIVQKFSELDPKTQKIIVIIGLVVAAIGPCLTILGTLVTAIGALLSPIGLVVAAIAGLIAAGLWLHSHWDQVCEWANNLKERVASAIESMRQRVHDSIEGVKAKFSEMKDKVSNIMNMVKNDISSKIEAAKSKVTSVVNAMKSGVTNTISSMRSAISSTFDSIKNGITSKINAAKSAVSNAISAIRGILSGTLSFPHIRVPHFSISGHLSLNPPSIPHVSVEWYKKAMNQPYILDGATIFGSMNGKMLGGGETGKEAIMSLDKLKEYAGSTVVEVNMTINGAKGQDVNVLADRVAERIYQQVRRAGA